MIKLVDIHELSEVKIEFLLFFRRLLLAWLFLSLLGRLSHRNCWKHCRIGIALNFNRVFLFLALIRPCQSNLMATALSLAVSLRIFSFKFQDVHGIIGMSETELFCVWPLVQNFFGFYYSWLSLFGVKLWSVEFFLIGLRYLFCFVIWVDFVQAVCLKIVRRRLFLVFFWINLLNLGDNCCLGLSIKVELFGTWSFSCRGDLFSFLFLRKINVSVGKVRRTKIKFLCFFNFPQTAEFKHFQIFIPILVCKELYLHTFSPLKALFKGELSFYWRLRKNQIFIFLNLISFTTSQIFLFLNVWIFLILFTKVKRNVNHNLRLLTWICFVWWSTSNLFSFYIEHDLLWGDFFWKNAFLFFFYNHFFNFYVFVT